MRVKGATVQKVMLGAALLAGLAWNLAQASEIKDLRLSNGATGTRAEIALDGPSEFKLISLAGPDRLVVDLPATHVARNLRLPPAIGVVKAVRHGSPTPGTTRIVFDLAQPVAALKPRVETGVDGARLVIEWPGDGSESVATQPNSTGLNTVNTIVPAEKTASAAATPTAIATQASVPATTPAVDAAAAEATSRLISEIAARASVPATGTSTAASQQPAPTTTSPAQTRIATGIPTPVTTAPTPSNTTTAPPGAVKTLQQVMRGRGMRPLVIAIDAGHGGQDPGALGAAGKREKDVTLAIARELARQVNATPGLKAFLIRDNDVFIPLNQRARLARNAKADMFVSIHADAAENRNASGSSVYVLSLKGASSQRARWLADKENASDMIGGVRLEQTSNTLASVLLDLTQSGQMKASEDAASHVLRGLQTVGRNHKPHVERANFAVLRTSDMPAMLVETAFISNPEEERRLTDPSHQRALARAVLDGVNTYFTRQPPPGTVYAARADAQFAASSGGAGGGAP